jgi:hypothetical protein
MRFRVEEAWCGGVATDDRTRLGNLAPESPLETRIVPAEWAALPS